MADSSVTIRSFVGKKFRTQPGSEGDLRLSTEQA